MDSGAGSDDDPTLTGTSGTGTRDEFVPERAAGRPTSRRPGLVYAAVLAVMAVVLGLAAASDPGSDGSSAAAAAGNGPGGAGSVGAGDADAGPGAGATGDGEDGSGQSGSGQDGSTGGAGDGVTDDGGTGTGGRGTGGAGAGDAGTGDDASGGGDGADGSTPNAPTTTPSPTTVPETPVEEGPTEAELVAAYEGAFRAHCDEIWSIAEGDGLLWDPDDAEAPAFTVNDCYAGSDPSIAGVLLTIDDARIEGFDGAEFMVFDLTLGGRLQNTSGTRIYE